MKTLMLMAAAACVLLPAGESIAAFCQSSNPCRRADSCGKCVGSAAGKGGHGAGGAPGALGGGNSDSSANGSGATQGFGGSCSTVAGNPVDVHFGNTHIPINDFRAYDSRGSLFFH